MQILKRFFKEFNGKQHLVTIEYDVDLEAMEDLEGYFDFLDDIERIRNGEITPFNLKVEVFDGHNSGTDYLGCCTVKDVEELHSFVEEYGMIDEAFRKLIN